MGEINSLGPKGTPKKLVIRNIILLFGLLIGAIISSAAYIAYQQNKTITQDTFNDLDSKLRTVVSIQNSEVEKLKSTIRIIREQNQKLADFLDYDQIKPITIMLQNISHIYSIDLICLFDEDGNLLSTNRTAARVTNPSTYGILIRDRQERSGVEEIPKVIFKEQFSNLRLKSDSARILCFKSIVHLLHDTGDICGFIVLVKLINENTALMEEMAEITGAEALYYDRDQNMVASSFPEIKMPFPKDGIIEHQGESYLVRMEDINNFSGQSISKLALAHNNRPFLEQRRWLLWNILLPFIAATTILLALFWLLKIRVFNKINQLITALHDVAEGEGDLSVRINVPREKTSYEGLDEVEHMIIDFNHMMKKMEDAYSSIRYEVQERKRTEDDLRESEEKYRSMMEAMNDAAYICSPDFRVQYMNPAMIAKVGGEYIGKTCYKALYGMDGVCDWCVFDDVQRGQHVENELLNPKDKRYYSITNSPIFHTDGSISKLTIFRDITEMKNIETQLQQAQKMEALGTLAGGVAHDLNNLLSGIVTYPELILMDLPEDSPLRKPIQTIKRSGKRAAVVVRDLMTLSQRGVAATEVLNMNTLISEQMNSPEVEHMKLFHKKVEFNTNFDKDLLNIKGSPAHLSKTVMNVLANAAEAMPDGGKISILSENVYIDRSVKGYELVEEGDYVSISISDTGVGISKEDINRIYEPFYTKKVMGRDGTGLGMAVVWGTVKDHHGHISVESTKGIGTTFKLLFPVCREEITIDKYRHPVEEFMGKGETILVVDDVEEQREIASKILERLGYSVKAVSDGEKAVEYMKNHSAELLLLDMIMDPGISGFETYKRILELHPKQKAIIASGFSETDDVRATLELGAGQYIKKPYAFEKIGIAVRDELEKS